MDYLAKANSSLETAWYKHYEKMLWKVANKYASIYSVDVEDLFEVALEAYTLARKNYQRQKGDFGMYLWVGLNNSIRKEAMKIHSDTMELPLNEVAEDSFELLQTQECDSSLLMQESIQELSEDGRTLVHAILKGIIAPIPSQTGKSKASRLRMYDQAHALFSWSRRKFYKIKNEVEQWWNTSELIA